MQLVALFKALIVQTVLKRKKDFVLRKEVGVNVILSFTFLLTITLTKLII